MTPEERECMIKMRALVELAADAGCDVKWMVDLFAKCLAAAQHEEPALIWVERTWTDVRAGDRVRMPGTEHVAEIAERYWPPTSDDRGRGSWHVVGGEKHWDDHIVQEGECVIRFATDPAGTARFMQPDMPVEIQMDSEVAMLMDLSAFGGWANRV